MSKKLTLIFTAFREKPLANAWRKYFNIDLIKRAMKEQNIEVKVLETSILDLTVDAIVSPANSFGFMTGGIDGFYTKKFGKGVQQKLQKIIKEKYHGELLVGEAELIPTENKQIPYVISAPTMRVGMTLNKETTNPYLAARAVFLLFDKLLKKAKNGEKDGVELKSIAFPGLGTGVGGVTYEACAFQVCKAFSHVLLKDFKFPKNHQPKDEHHELWQIDKPNSVIDIEGRYFLKSLNTGKPSRIVSCFFKNAEIIESSSQKIFRGRDAIVDYWDDLIMNNNDDSAYWEISVTGIKPISHNEIHVKLNFSFGSDDGSWEIVWTKDASSEWRIFKLKVL